MHVCSLILYNFRNYVELKLNLHPQLNLFLGLNAQGKTNILEAIFYLSTSQSFRSVYDEEVIRFGAERSCIECCLDNKGKKENIRLEINRRKKKVLHFNEKKQAKLSAILGRLPTVVFSPDDLYLVKGGPSFRRRLLDSIQIQIDPNYLYHLQQYERILKNRNALLRKKTNVEKKELFVWDIPFSEHAAELIKKRKVMISKLSQQAYYELNELTGGEEKFEICYKASMNSNSNENITQEEIMNVLKRNRNLEIKIGSTIVGPHRDDLDLLVDGKLLRRFGSQGQQRSAALALKLAKMKILTEQCRTKPLILFDDVMAELDEKRRKFFLNRLQQGGQVFLTGTSSSDFSEALDYARVFEVENGKVSVIKEGLKIQIKAS